MIRTVAGIIARGLLPYPDLMRRWRIRRLACRLTGDGPWPDDDAVTGPDAARLALLRALHLQRQTRRAVRGRHREAAVLLSRGAVENCIVGLWCLHSPDAVDRLKAAELKSGPSMVALLSSTGLIPEPLIKDALAALGSAKTLTPLRDMVDIVDREMEASLAIHLYRFFYQPASTVFVHANASSLLRHVRAGNRMSPRPAVPWARRSAIRLADACVGILTAAVARQSGAPIAFPAKYAEGHAARVLPLLPLPGGWRAGLGPAVGLTVVRQVWNLRRYLGGSGTTASRAEREARIRDLFATVTDAFVMSPDSVDPVLDHLVEVVIAEWEAEAGSTQADPAPA